MDISQGMLEDTLVYLTQIKYIYTYAYIHIYVYIYLDETYKTYLSYFVYITEQNK